MQGGSVISLPASFNSYSDSRLTENAARVVEEFGSGEFYDEFYFGREESSGFVETETGNSCITEEDGDAFEFAFVERNSGFPSPVSADEIFCNGQIRPLYPIFNRDLYLKRNEFEKDNDVVPSSDPEKDPTVRLPLRKLFTEERETTIAMATTASSSSSSEADELEGVPVETYCVWRPKEAEAAVGGCKKSSSTGSNSKRWKFRDLLHRSHSDGGKDRFVFLSPTNRGRREENEKKVNSAVGDGKAKSAAAAALYNREVGEKRRSYMPYRQDFGGPFR